MRRGRKHSVETYVQVRVKQLQEDMDKAHDERDKKWYNRLIQELNWAVLPSHNCWMSQDGTNTD